ncbi:MAG: cytochrome c oxidase assembly protein [Stenotrophobium sp.]
MNSLSPSAAARARYALRYTLPAVLTCAALIALWHDPMGRALLEFLLPWEFSPTVIGITLLLLVLYSRGLWLALRAGEHIVFWSPAAYYLGVLLLYVSLQSHVDYYAEHMFYIHRLQHLVLHHLGPFLLALAAPIPLLRRGTPQAWLSAWLDPFFQSRTVRAVSAFISHPVVAPTLFLGGIGIWLLPGLHFDAMLSVPLNKLMNWSMLLDGLPFWWLILDRRPAPPARLGYGGRILMMWFIMIPQIVLGAVITLSRHDLYPVYDLCGRAFALTPIQDQQIGGLIIWIPASMMSVIASLIVISFYRQER